MEDTGLGSLLRRHRDAAGLTQEELAERAGISSRTISDVERGLRDGVFRDTAARIAVALGLAGDQRTRFEAVARGRRGRPGQPAQEAWKPAAAPPVPLTRLIGREQEIATILARLRDPQVRLLTLTGMGGIGKTRLALAASTAVGGDFGDGVCFVSLAQTRDPALVASLVAQALGVNPARDPVADLIKAHLAQRRVLVVLDTFETVLDAGPFVADLLTSCPGLTVLVTSRAALRVRGEYEFAVPPLGLAADGAAAALFAERALAVRGDLNLRGSAAPVVAEICRRLDGVPLAIELAAARVKHLPVIAVRDHLDHRLGVLTGGAQDLPPRQRAMRDTIAWSYDLLDVDTQTLFRRLSVFVGWTLESARVVCAASEPAVDVLTSLSTLVDHSLVTLAQGQPTVARYAMPDVVKEYAVERCDADGETPVLADRHADHFTVMAEQAEPALRRSGQRDWHHTLDADLPNLRQAFHWSIQHQDAGRALRLAGAVWMFWLWHGGFVEGRTWLTHALSLPSGGYPTARAKALWGAGWLAYHQGDYADTAASAAALLDLAPATGNPLDRRNGLTLRGMTDMAERRHREAVSVFEEALQICRRLDAPWLFATSALNLGTAAMHSGDLDRADELLGQARARYQDLGDDAYHARATRHLAICRLLRDQPRQAAELLNAGQTPPPNEGDWDQAETLEALSLVNAATGDPRRAAALAAAATAVRQRTGTRPHPFDRALAEPYLARARADPNAWDAGWRAGIDLSPDDITGLTAGA
jgi:predicted ATPase/DNA-binding XRE family transcriptional regulator